MLHSLVDNWSNYDVTKIKRKIDEIKVVSFDIFDTLIKRDIKNPVDLFQIVERKTNCKNFAQKRIAAEKLARKTLAVEEVTLTDIYTFLDVPYDIEKLMDCEIECEIAISSINYEIIGLFRFCVKNKIVVLTSDMYLPQSVIERILEKNGISGYKKIFLSNNYGKTKLYGELYRKVIDNIGVKPSEIVHIGNSFKADFIAAKRLGIRSVKCSTYKNRLQRVYDNCLLAEPFKYELLQSFLNNHTPASSNDEYYTFGYEVFGPLLYGFVKWLHEEIKRDNIEQIFFLSRDGYIMKKLYDQMGYITPSFYLEVSRRSLRVPRYNRSYSYEDMIETLTVPNMTNVIQIMDSFGLDYSEYISEISQCGISVEEQVKRDTLKENAKFRLLFNIIKEDLFTNAEKEKERLLKYLLKYDFSKKTAIVDIGWGGSMQKYLLESLKDLKINCNITGYYVGVTRKAKENLKLNMYRARGYAFDCLNKDEQELESSYIGLIESLFLEQDGSVKCYVEKNFNVTALRYDYEYLEDGHLSDEAINVSRVQEGAVKFASDFDKSINSELIGSDSKVFYGNMHEVGANPINRNIKQFGTFRFFNCGNQVQLAHPRKLSTYCVHRSLLKKDIYDSQWKIGFLKALLKLDLPYTKMYSILRRLAN